LSESSQKYCGFYVDGVGQYCWTVTPFGCMNASKTAQKLVDKLLSGLRDVAAAFQDDIICYSSSFEQHLVDLTNIFTRLREAKLTANASKCEFLVEKLALLGHVIQNGQIRPSEDKLTSIANLSSASITTKKQLRSALGLINFFRDFIPNCAEIALPLTVLLKKNKPEKVILNDVCESALKRLKDMLLSDRCLYAPDSCKPYHLFTDASAGAIGGWIGQYDSEQRLRPIAFASKKLTDCQLNYSVIEKELFAVMWSVKHFQQYLYDCEIHLYSDHRPLQWLHTLTQHSPRLARWSLMLQNFHIIPHYIKGSNNVVADALSIL
jgi:putative transposase